ncbi:Hypothetical predicted protein [Octopus vulgaris]|uniref:Uncharacterized protein n=1 Tax=Octopus vulgaris TaxID=6645 RepID=A0AA36FQF0_OCTVU|nr:Hypothetical predicted protein [Octopus vulgaris]
MSTEMCRDFSKQPIGILHLQQCQPCLQELLTERYYDSCQNKRPQRDVLLQNGVRRFYITNHNGGCSVESGWLALNEAGVYCAYDKMNHFPAIRYSDAKSRTIWNSGYALADSMAIFIRLRQQN